MSTKDIEEFTRRNIEAVNKGKAAGFAFVDEHYAADIVMHGIFGGESRGLRNANRCSASSMTCFPTFILP